MEQRVRRGPMTRRSILGAGLFIGAGAATAACAPGGPPTGSGESGGRSAAQPPTFVPFPGLPKPDLVGDSTKGVPHGYLSYPDPPVKGGRVPLGVGAPLGVLIQGKMPSVSREQNQWWSKWEADLGTTLDITATDSTQYTPKFQTAVAGNQIRDITQVVNVPQLPGVLEKFFTDLTPFLSGENVKKYPGLANIPPDTWKLSTIRGKIWGVTSPWTPGGQILMSRGDLLAGKGIDKVPSLADGEAFLDMCREVTDRKNGVFAIGQIVHNWIVPILVEAMGGPNSWKVEGGNWTSALESPEWLSALETASKMWAEGLFHPNSYSDLSSTPLWFDSGATVLWAQNFSSWTRRLGNAPYPLGAVAMPRWNGGGAAAKHLGPAGYASFIGIKKTDDTKRIEDILRVFDFVATPFGTEEYLTVNVGVRGHQYELTNGQVKLNKDKAATGETVPGMLYAGSNANSVLYSSTGTETTKMAFDYCQQHLPSGIPDPSQGRFSETGLTKGASARAKLNDLMGNIIQGRAKLSEWEAGVKAWKVAAGDAIAREYAEQD